MSKGIIKEKKPQKLSRLEVLKAWIAESIASIKRNLKDGGWKGTALGAAAVTSMVGAGIVLVACVPTEVQIEEVTSESEVNRLVSANFSEEEAVRDEMTKQYGALSDFEYNNGKATANVERNGKSYAVSAEIDLGASDFEVTKYTNAELSGNNLTYTSEGQDVSENVSDKIVVEENGVIYVIDPSGALNTISIAVSDAILTENVDPENPGGEDKPDPDEPENPGGEENPDPDEPENPGGEDKPDPDEPDPDEPENPGGEENPDPDKPTEITFDSWQELVDLIGTENESTLEQAMAEIIKKNLVTLDFVQWVVGSYSGRPETTLENTDTLKLAFKLNQNQEIESISWMGVRYAFRSDTEDHLRVVTVPLTSPISYKTIKVTENLAEDQKNDNCISFGDITLDLSNYANEILYDKNAITVDQLYYGSHSLTETNLSYFDLCMPLAVKAGLIDADAKLGFVNVQVSGGVIGSEFGNAINANLQFIDLNTNMKYNISILFADTRTNGSTTMLEEMKKAVASGEYRVRAIQDNLQIISGDQIFEFEDALDGVVTYTISAENQK